MLNQKWSTQLSVTKRVSNEQTKTNRKRIWPIPFIFGIAAVFFRAEIATIIAVFGRLRRGCLRRVCDICDIWHCGCSCCCCCCFLIFVICFLVGVFNIWDVVPFITNWRFPRCVTIGLIFRVPFWLDRIIWRSDFVAKRKKKCKFKRVGIIGAFFRSDLINNLIYFFYPCRQ